MVQRSNVIKCYKMLCKFTCSKITQYDQIFLRVQIDFENRLKSTSFQRSNHRSRFKLSRLHHIGIKTILFVTPMTPIRSHLASFRHCWNEITAITRMLSRIVSRQNHTTFRIFFPIFYAICLIFLADKLGVLGAIWLCFPRIIGDHIDINSGSSNFCWKR